MSGECGGDELFLSLYKELTLRHLHSIARPSPKDRVEGWHVYCALFDSILKNASEAESSPEKIIYLLPEWIFDVLHEFVYQFQGFCQFRTTTYTSAAKSDGDSDKVPSHTKDAIETLTQNRDAWAVETVLSYLHRLIAVGTQNKNASASYRFLAYFSSVTLSRLECLLGDYRASIAALDVIYDKEAMPVAVGEDMIT